MLAIPRALVSEPMNTCVPGRPSRSWSLCSAVLRKNGASRWIAIRSRHAATGTAAAAARYCVPAACTMPSSGPPVAPLALAISWSACSRSATSAGSGMTRPAGSSAAVSFSWASVRATATTPPPAAAIASAMARPRPRPAPVTM